MVLRPQARVQIDSAEQSAEGISVFAEDVVFDSPEEKERYLSVLRDKCIAAINEIDDLEKLTLIFECIRAVDEGREIMLSLRKTLPETAPKVYQGPATDGNVVEFINAVWGPWLDGISMHRGDLRRLDSAAYARLMNEERKPNSRTPLEVLNLPAKSDALDNHAALLKRFGLTQPSREVRRQGRSRNIFPEP